MKEIKFRAWSRRYKRFVLLTLVGAEVVCTWEDGTQYGDEKDLENFGLSEWMRFTGAKDRNGKDIYDGDIIEWEGRPGGYRLIMWSDRKLEWQASWNLGTFKLTAGKAKRMTVIGNLHENPELLQ